MDPVGDDPGNYAPTWKVYFFVYLLIIYFTDLAGGIKNSYT